MCQEDICQAQVSHKADMCTSLALVKQYYSGASQRLEIGIDFATLTIESQISAFVCKTYQGLLKHLDQLCLL